MIKGEKIARRVGSVIVRVSRKGKTIVERGGGGRICFFIYKIIGLCSQVQPPHAQKAAQWGHALHLYWVWRGLQKAGISPVICLFVIMSQCCRRGQEDDNGSKILYIQNVQDLYTICSTICTCQNRKCKQELVRQIICSLMFRMRENKGEKRFSAAAIILSSWSRKYWNF